MERKIPNRLRRDKRDACLAGYSLIELLLTLAVSVVLLIAVGSLVSSSHGAMNDMMGVATMNEEGKRVMDRILWEMRFASSNTVTLAQPIDAHSVTFQKMIGWAGDAPTLSPPQTLLFSGGQVFLNGITIAGGISNLTLNRSGTSYTIAVQVDRTIWSGGTGRSFTRTFISQLSL